MDKLVEEYTENVEEAKITEITLFEHEDKCKSSCTINVILIMIIFISCIGVGTYFVYYKYMNYIKKTVPKYDYIYQASNY